METCVQNETPYSLKIKARVTYTLKEKQVSLELLEVIIQLDET